MPLKPQHKSCKLKGLIRIGVNFGFTPLAFNALQCIAKHCNDICCCTCAGGTEKQRCTFTICIISLITERANLHKWKNINIDVNENMKGKNIELQKQYDYKKWCCWSKNVSKSGCTVCIIFLIINIARIANAVQCHN